MPCVAHKKVWNNAQEALMLFQMNLLFGDFLLGKCSNFDIHVGCGAQLDGFHLQRLVGLKKSRCRSRAEAIRPHGQVNMLRWNAGEPEVSGCIRSGDAVSIGVMQVHPDLSAYDDAAVRISYGAAKGCGISRRAFLMGPC